MDFGLSGGIYAKLVHCSGETIVSAAAKEYAVSKYITKWVTISLPCESFLARRHLRSPFSLSDNVAVKAIAYIFAKRCHECGITEMIIDPIREENFDHEPRVRRVSRSKFSIHH